MEVSDVDQQDHTYTNPSFDTPDNQSTKSGIRSKLFDSNGINRNQVNIELGEKIVETQEEWGGERVVLVGSGDMTRALVTNLIRAGYTPVVATRDPARARTWFTSDEVEVRTVGEGLSLAGDLVVVAIPAQHHSSLPKELLRDKIVVDVSNRSPEDSSRGLSLAEQLQQMLPESHVVKALNTMSAYVLQRPDFSATRQVPVCGNEAWARARVVALVRHLGLTPLDMGGLRNARALEDIPLSFFPEWKLTAIITGVVFTFFFILLLFRIQICPNLESETWDWHSFEILPLKNVQLTLAFTACFLLLTCYFPGVIAAYLQLWRGTKYSQFPNWLDNWLKGRKQIGLMALLLGATHGCMAIFYVILKGLDDEWRKSTYICLGALLLAVLVILAITSLPSMSSTLTWREFSAVQRYLGWSSVLLVSGHMIFAELHDLTESLSCVVIPSGAQIMVPLCLLTVALKAPLVLPCVDSYLTKIRRGYERPQRH